MSLRMMRARLSPNLAVPFFGSTKAKVTPCDQDEDISARITFAFAGTAIPLPKGSRSSKAAAVSKIRKKGWSPSETFPTKKAIKNPSVQIDGITSVPEDLFMELLVAGERARQRGQHAERRPSAMALDLGFKRRLVLAKVDNASRKRSPQLPKVV